MEFNEAVKCLEIRCPVLGINLDGVKFTTRKYPYIYEVKVKLDMNGKANYFGVLADVLALSGEPKSTVTMRLENVKKVTT